MFWSNRRPPIYRRLYFVTEEMLRTMLGDLETQILEVRKGRFLIVAFRIKESPKNAKLELEKRREG